MLAAAESSHHEPLDCHRWSAAVAGDSCLATAGVVGGATSAGNTFVGKLGVVGGATSAGNVFVGKTGGNAGGGRGREADREARVGIAFSGGLTLEVGCSCRFGAASGVGGAGPTGTGAAPAGGGPRT